MIPCLQQLVSLALFACLIASPVAAGTLGGVRDSVRSDDRNKQDDDHRSAGKLPSARQEVRSERKANSTRPRPRHRPRRSGGGGPWFSFANGFFDYPCTPAYAPPVVYYPAPVVAGPQVVAAPPVIVEAPAPDYNPPSVAASFDSFANSFAPAPYADGCAGCLFPNVSGPRKWWSGQVTFELGDAGGQVDRAGVGFLLEESNGFGVDFDLDSFSESLPAGGHDELHLGQVNFLYRVLETEQALVRVGLGVNWMNDQYATDGGLNFTARADLFPRRPWVVSTELDLGTLGDAQTTHAAVTTGVALGHAELYGGYDYRRIGDTQLKGPMLGLRVWW